MLINGSQVPGLANLLQHAACLTLSPATNYEENTPQQTNNPKCEKHYKHLIILLKVRLINKVLLNQFSNIISPHKAVLKMFCYKIILYFYLMLSRHFIIFEFSFSIVPISLETTGVMLTYSTGSVPGSSNFLNLVVFEKSAHP